MTRQDQRDFQQEPRADGHSLASVLSGSVASSATQAADWMFLHPAVLDEMHDSVIVMDLNGTILTCNRVARELYGYRDEELFGTNVAVLYPEEDRKTVLAETLQSVREGRGFRGEARRLTRSGDSIYTQLSLVLLKDGDGRPAAIASFSADLTAHKLGDLARRQSDSVERQNQGTESGSIVLKPTDLELRRANDRLASVLSCMTDGLCLFDSNWLFTYINPEAERILQIRLEDAVGQSLWALFPEAMHSGFHKHMTHAIQTGEAAHFDEFYPEPLNKWLDCHCHPTDDGMSFYLRDITQRRRYLAAMTDSESRARLGMQVASLALAEIDYSTGLNHLSADAAKMFGIGEKAVTVPRQRVHATFHPDDLPELRSRIEGCLDPKGTGWFSMDHRVVWPEGEIHWLRVRKQVYFAADDAGGRRPVRAMLAAFDVTVEKAALEDARRGEERFRTLAESLPQLVWEADGHGVKLYCNHKYLEYSGHASFEEIQDHWLDLIHPEDRERTAKRWTESLRTGQPYMAEYRLRRADGEFRHFVAHAVPTFDSTQRTVRWLGASTDIHDQKLAEESLRRSEMVAAAGKLAASVAHEINNPLTSVINLLFLMESDTKLDPVNREYLAMAQEELGRITEMTTQSLRFHKQSVSSVPVRLDQLLESILKLQRRRIVQQKINVIRDQRLSTPFECRADDVRQAIANVMDNAIDASPEGATIRVRLRAGQRWTGSPTRGVRITIADQGPGIPADNVPRIFQAFFSTKGITRTGLGLWVTQDLVSRCGGTIAVRSSTRTIQHGTVFTIFLPEPQLPVE